MQSGKQRNHSFNSRSRMGSDQGWYRRTRRQRRFNSRSRMGSDTTSPRPPSAILCFNSRSRMGSDFQYVSKFICNPRFQFALPHGERRRRHSTALAREGFNSRSRMGSDGMPKAYTFPKPVSIRAPAWGATDTADANRCKDTVSIRAPAWGATELDDDAAIRGRVSIRAPAWGATTCFSWIAASNVARFNSRSRMGSDEYRSKAQ